MSPGNPIILCVDDQEENLKLLEQILVPKGYALVNAASGADALLKIKSQPVDLVLLDIMMPVMDGFEVCRQIKEDPKLRNIPVIMISSLTAKQDRIRGIEAGAEEFLSKPFDQSEVIARIKLLLKMKRLNDARERAEQALQKSHDELDCQVQERTAELAQANAMLQADITERKQAEETLRISEAELYDNNYAQSAINTILSESLGDSPIEDILQKALNVILSVPWLSSKAAGSIFLVEDEPEVLILKVQTNLPEPLMKLCSHIPFGKCLCGKTAQTRQIQFADHIDARHEINCEKIAPHGNYTVPLLFGGRTLGVINILLEEGHIRSQREEDFLHTAADTLAGVIARRQVENDKEKLHAQLLQAQKMEAVGQLAGGISHDFNNLLTAIIGYGHMLQMKLKENDTLRTYADHILSLSDKAANLTHSLLAFSRKQFMNPRPVNLNDVIGRIDHLLSRIIGEDIRLQTMPSENAVIVMADPGQIEQVLMNLATNARDAMHEGGLLTIATETIDIDQEFIKEHGFGKEGSHVVISVTDSGEGMDRETMEKIFVPFFTTKEVGKGTGLGLAMVYGIIKQHNGHINVYSEPGRGTTFRIYLPLIEAKAVDETKMEVIKPLETGTETILLTEDEAVVREFTKKLLEEYGYKVIAAIDGDDAIGKFRLHKNKIQLVLLDVIMPNRNGREVYEAIRKITPDIKVLFTSGYPADHINGMIAKGSEFIIKPGSPTKLLKKIREVLDGR